MAPFAAPPAPTRPLRVLMLAACPFPCMRGTPARVLQQALGLRDLGHQVEVAAYPLSDQPDPEGVAVRRSPRLPGYHRLAAGPDLRKLALLDPMLLRTALGAARRFRPDVIHAHHVEGALIGFAVRARSGIPVVYDAHTLVGEELPLYGLPLPAPFLRRLGAAVDRTCARRADRVCATTETLAARLRALCGDTASASRIGAVRTPAALPPLLEREIERSRAGRKPGSTVVYAGGLARLQNPEILMSALDALRERVERTRLRIVTADRPEGELARWVAARPWVEVAGSPDLRSVFRALVDADVAIATRSAPGGLPQKLLNYMAVGLPIVASQGCAELIDHGRTGLVVRDGDAKGFARALRTLLEDPSLAQRMGAAAQRASLAMRAESPVHELVGTYLALSGTSA